jgi:hypothetical protein
MQVLHHIHARTPPPLLCWEQFARTKFEVLKAGLLKSKFLCIHHQNQSTQRLFDPEDKSITILFKKTIVYQSTRCIIPEGFKSLGTPQSDN